MSFVGNNGDVYQQSGSDGGYLYTWQNPQTGITVVDNHVDGLPFEPVPICPNNFCPEVVIHYDPPPVTHYDPPPVLTPPPATPITEIHVDDGGSVNQVPEPSSAVLMLLGCLLIALWFQYRRKVPATVPSGSCVCAEDSTEGTGICWDCRKTRV
jgi:hypothetical protein